MTRPALLDYLLILTARLPFHDENAKRLRIAVTPEEMDEMRAYSLITEGRFFSRVRDVQLVVEKNPLCPDLLIESEKDDPPYGRHTIMRTL